MNEPYDKRAYNLLVGAKGFIDYFAYGDHDDSRAKELSDAIDKYLTECDEKDEEIKSS